jgi:hypothetical protein
MPKQRNQYVYIGCEEKFERVFDSEDSIRLPDDGRTYYIFHRREYDRARKPKILYALFQFFGSRSVKKDPVEELKKYDSIYAIDTNFTKTAVTTASTAGWVPTKGIFATKKLFTRKWAPTTSKPEREAWMAFIGQLAVLDGSHNCLAVDSDLEALIKINRREEPIMPGAFLPQSWQLNYASSDAADDFILVRMMRLCEEANKRGKVAEYSAG